MFTEATRREIAPVAAELGVPLAALLAVVEVESAGIPYAKVDGKNVPLIRWEGHYFYKRLFGDALNRAVAAGLASPKAGGIANPKTQQGRYELLARAMKIDAGAALESCSWGVGQVMGAHWKWLGYPSAQAMVDEAMSGLSGQVAVMARFIRKSGLIDELQRRDWAAFARTYNGPAYKTNRYDTKMAEAYARWSKVEGTAPKKNEIPKNWLSLGDNGSEVEALQTKLRRAGHNIEVDGDYGPATRDAVMAFQKEQGLKADGVFGENTQARLDALSTPPAKMSLPAETEIKVAPVTAGIGAAGSAVAEAASQIQPLAAASNVLMWIFVGLTVVSVGVTLYALIRRSMSSPKPS